jgi:hypothetical protein
VLQQQEAVISRALEVWGGYAAARAAERMGEWERALEAEEAAGEGAASSGALTPDAAPWDGSSARAAGGPAWSWDATEPLDVGRPRDSAEALSAAEPSTATDELRALFRAADISADDDHDESAPAPTKPLPRNTDRASFLRRAGLPDQL